LTLDEVKTTIEEVKITVFSNAEQLDEDRFNILYEYINKTLAEADAWFLKGSFDEDVMDKVTLYIWREACKLTVS
jgi:hypothetical protein